MSHHHTFMHTTHTHIPPIYRNGDGLGFGPGECVCELLSSAFVNIVEAIAKCYCMLENKYKMGKSKSPPKSSVLLS